VIFIESDISYDYFPAQTTSNEGSDHNPFQATSDERGLGRLGSSFRNAAITKPGKPKSRSKHLAPTTRTGSTWTTLVVPTKMPHPVMNCVLGLAVVTTWQ
ncbi:hypothetical protein Tco_0883462, partial [Tanacetum coccineum]